MTSGVGERQDWVRNSLEARGRRGEKGRRSRTGESLSYILGFNSQVCASARSMLRHQARLRGPWIREQGTNLE